MFQGENIELNSKKNLKIGLGGGCHWCTEAVFQQIGGVANVEQGWIASSAPNESLSEAVIVHYDSQQVSIEHLIDVHLVTHSSRSSHSMRKKYRSAIYYFDGVSCERAVTYLKSKANKNVITLVLPFASFKKNEETYIDYYKKNPDSPFCKRYIEPKLKMIRSLN